MDNFGIHANLSPTPMRSQSVQPCHLRSCVDEALGAFTSRHPGRSARAVLDPRVPAAVLCQPQDLVTLVSLLLESAQEGSRDLTLYIYEADDPHACVLRYELLGTASSPLPPKVAELAAKLGGESGVQQPWFTMVASRQGGHSTPDEILPGRGLAVLVVEDNLVNQRLAEECLRHLGAAYRMASNGKEAVQLAGAEEFDLILMDIHMPVMDGITATRAIRALPGSRHPYITALTAFALPGDRERCLEAGMDDYLTKPCRVDVLAGVISKVAARKKPFRAGFDIPPSS